LYLKEEVEIRERGLYNLFSSANISFFISNPDEKILFWGPRCNLDIKELGRDNAKWTELTCGIPFYGPAESKGVL
jgi:hypothetical protein